MVYKLACYHCIEVYENIIDKLRQLRLDLGDLRNNIKTLRHFYSQKKEELILPKNFENTVEDQIKIAIAHYKTMEKKYRDKAYKRGFSKYDWEIIKSIESDIISLRTNLRFMESVVGERTEGSYTGLSTSVLESITEGIVGRQKIYQAADAVAQYFFSILGLQWNGICCFTMEPCYSIINKTNIVNLPPFAESRTRFWILMAHEACHEKIEDTVKNSIDGLKNEFFEFLELFFDLKSSLSEFLPDLGMSNLSEKSLLDECGLSTLLKLRDLDVDNLDVDEEDESQREELQEEINKLTRNLDNIIEKSIFDPESPYFPIVEILTDILASEITGIAYFSAILCYILYPYDLKYECPPSALLKGTAIVKTLMHVGILGNSEMDVIWDTNQKESLGNNSKEIIKDDEIYYCLLQSWDSYVKAQKKIHPDPLKEQILEKIDWGNIIERLNRIVFPDKKGKTEIEQKERYSEFNEKVNKFLTEYMIPRRLPVEDVIAEFNPAVILNAVWKLRMGRSITKLRLQGKNNGKLSENLRLLEIKGTHLAIFALYKWYYYQNSQEVRQCLKNPNSKDLLES